VRDQPFTCDEPSRSGGRLTTDKILPVGRRLLLVEDNFHIAKLMAENLEAQGVEVIGPAGTVESALALIADVERIDGAAIDINLRGEMAYPVIDVLRAKAVRTVILTGYDPKSIASDYADVPCMLKPVKIEHLLEILFK